MKKKCNECGRKRELVEGKTTCWSCHVGSVGFGSVPGGARASSTVDEKNVDYYQTLSVK